MADTRVPPHPPSDPHPLLSRAARLSGGLFAVDERPGRAALIAALLLGLGLVAVGLYLWRRPPAAADTQASSEGAEAHSLALSTPDGEAPGALLPDAGPASPVALSDPRVLGCHDRGPKVTLAEQCDHLTLIEKALSSAVEQAAGCVPSANSGTTIEYVADVSFSKRKVSLSLPRAGRSLRDRKVLHACANAVRSAVSAVPLDSVEHQHARYKISHGHLPGPLVRR